MLGLRILSEEMICYDYPHVESGVFESRGAIAPAGGLELG